MLRLAYNLHGCTVVARVNAAEHLPFASCKVYE